MIYKGFELINIIRTQCHSKPLKPDALSSEPDDLDQGNVQLLKLVLNIFFNKIRSLLCWFFRILKDKKLFCHFDILHQCQLCVINFPFFIFEAWSVVRENQPEDLQSVHSYQANCGILLSILFDPAPRARTLAVELLRDFLQQCKQFISKVCETVGSGILIDILE